MGAAQKFTIAQIHELAKSRKVELLTPEYFGMLKKHRWRCLRSRHYFWATPNDVKSMKGGCPRCSRLGCCTPISRLQQIAKRVGVKILETEPQGQNNPHRAECLNCGFRWKPRPKNLLAGTGCPRCYRFRRRFKRKWRSALQRYLARS